MKKFAWVIICLIPFVSSGQKEHPDLFKSSRINHYKNNINIYYNPLLDHYDLHFVKLDIEVTDQSTSIAGNALLQGKATQNLDTLILELSNYLTVDSVMIDNAKVNFQHKDNLIWYIFESALNTNDDFTAQVYYHGTPNPNGGGVSNAYSSQWDKQMTWTLSESFHAYEWWPCKQVLSDKIDSVYVFLTCDSNCKAGSNGLLTREVDLPNNKKRFEWKTYYPINYYLISFAVAEYQDYSIYAHPTGSNPILIQNYIYNTPGCLDYYQTQIDETPSMIELFSDKFGLYPFANEKYGHCLTTLGGGMEHQTMTTLGNFGYTLVGHELAHMWFGDFVTCATWQDIWINEGFASYSEYILLENLQSIESAKSWMLNAHNYAFERTTGSIYIPFEQAFNESRIFDYRLSYKKGAAIIHTLRNEIHNDDLFFSAIRAYLDVFADSVATGDDFKLTMEKETGMNLGPFFNQWYYGEGYPQFDVEYYQTNDTLYLTVKESTSSANTPLFQLHVDYKIVANDRDTVVRLYQSKNVETHTIPFSSTVSNIIVDPENWILNIPGTVKKTDQSIDDQVLFMLHPNLVKDEIQISFHNQFLNQNKTITLYDLQGRIIKSYQTDQLLLPLNLSYLSKGYYFIRIICQSKTKTFKIIKI